MTRGPNQKGTKLVAIDAQRKYVLVCSTEYRERSYVRRVQYNIAPNKQQTKPTHSYIHGTLTMVGMNGSSVPVLCVVVVDGCHQKTKERTHIIRNNQTGLVLYECTRSILQNAKDSLIH